MRQSPRLIQGKQERAGTPGSLPRTPRHTKSGSALDQLITSLEQEFQLGLQVRDKSWTPQKSDGAPLADKVYGQIKHLFFSSRPTLDATVEEFRSLKRRVEKDQQLSCLHVLLVRNKARSPASRAGTPGSRPPKILQAEQPSVAATVKPSNPTGLFKNYANKQNQSESDSYRTAIEDPGSPTDVEEDAFFTPPSPTLSAMKRRTYAEASQLTASPISKKRSLGDSSSDHSPKFSKTAHGKEPTTLYPNLPKLPAPDFKIPSLGIVRSFQQVDPTAMSSANTSFNTNNMTWSQRTLVDDSAATSFTTDGAADEPFRQHLARKSSVEFGYLFPRATSTQQAEKDLFESNKQREQDRIFSQEASKESASTYGSVDEDDMCVASRDAELKANSLSSKNGTSPLDPELSKAANKAVTLPPSVPSRVDSASRPDNESPSKVDWYLRDLPKQNLFIKEEMPVGSLNVPYFLAFMCCRIALTENVSIKQVIRAIALSDARSESSAFWGSLSHYSRSSPQESSEVWSASRKAFEGYTFKGKMTFNNVRSEPAFKLELLPIQPETSCLLQRMFGSDRFLYLTFPSFDGKATARFSKEQLSQIEAKWKMWLYEEHVFLGRRWRAFHVETIKKSTFKKDDTAGTRVVLFATEGDALDTISIGEMINTFFPFDKNKDQNFCKAFARLDLALSRTIATLIFKPSQIHRIPDRLADGTPDAQEFDDMTIDWSGRSKTPPVMNDGCARISVGAAKQIWEHIRKVTGTDDPLPSSFQGRIAGAKGMWMISAEPHTTDPFHLGVWIEISDSQLKFEPADEDLDDERFNPHRTSFNYVKHSHVKGSSDLHISFIPILEDRGVPKDVISKLISEQLDAERSKLLEMLSNPVRLHNWVMKQGAATPASGLLSWHGALPISLVEKIKHLLRSGLDPTRNPYVARVLKKFVRQRQIWMEEKLRAPLGKATFLLGLADPLGVLKPGEVHVNFSKPFQDDFDGKTYRSLAGEEVVVARQPACRRSDMQKMRAVSHPKLSHLVDVIVFPVQGQFSAAGKLQGGDYDGDIFWTCWEPALVEPFRNAPAPLNDPDPLSCGIRKDTRKLGDIMDTYDLSTVDGFLRLALEFKTLGFLLGKATNFAEKVAYRENRLYSENLNALYDLHDLLVDSAKNGYRFEDKDFIQFIKRLRCGNPRTPAYKEAMEASLKSKDAGEEDAEDIKDKLRYKPNNIIDYLYFEIIREHNKTTRKSLHDALPKEDQDADDSDLRYPYVTQRDLNSPTINAELSRLLRGIEDIVIDWNRSLGDKSDLTPEKYNHLVDTCYNAFRALSPSAANASHHRIAPLTNKYLGKNHPTIWEYIRVSALYTAYPKKHAFVWLMAGRELTRLKAGENPDTYNVVPGVYADLKTKPIKSSLAKPDPGEQSDDEFEAVLEQLNG